MHQITVQRAVAKTIFTPTATQLKRWAETALKRTSATGELTIRITGPAEITELNHTYRHKNKPTNVLSFPYDSPLLGDVIICADVVNQEASEQHKSADAHWAHMVIHGILHLLGHDHETDTDATLMEDLEIQILASLGFANPYHIKKGENHE